MSGNTIFATISVAVFITVGLGAALAQFGLMVFFLMKWGPVWVNDDADHVVFFLSDMFVFSPGLAYAWAVLITPSVAIAGITISTSIARLEDATTATSVWGWVSVTGDMGGSAMMCAYPFSSHFCVTKSTKSFPGAEKGNAQAFGVVNMNDLTLAWSSRNCTDTLIAGGPTWLNLALWLSKHAELMGPCKPRYTYHELVADLEPCRPMHRHPTSAGTDALICSHFDECLDACSEERLRVSSGHPAGQKISDPVLR
ncbi:hypothetical protein T484DRAFT_1860430, partial [Baffinella frigidus]